MRHFDVGMECFVIGIYKFRDTRQWHSRTAKTSELFCIDISFFFEEYVQHTDQCSSLTGIIIESQQLESGIIGGTQCLFNLMFVAESLKFTRSHHKVVTLTSHMVIIQNIPEDFKILRFVDPSVLTDFIEIREYAPLTCLMRNIRLFHRIYPCTIVRHAFRTGTCPTQSACSGFHMKLIVRLPLPAISYGSSRIYMAWVGRFPIIHKLAYPCHPTTGQKEWKRIWFNP